jgi:serine/threonine-protein kinase
MSRCPHCGGTHNADNHFCPATGSPIDLGPRLVGLTLLDHFRVVTILGEGPTGIVLEVEDLRSQKRLAAKLIHPQFTRQGNAAERLLAEARRAGSLGCPHIAQVVEVGRDTGAAPTIVRELMVGECLQEIFDRSDRLPLLDAIRITREILIALRAIHKVGLVNLDLSPADVFLDRSSGTVVTRLVDFGEGVFKQDLRLPDGEEPDSHQYFAPEQRRKGAKADARADLYAAGAILYHALTGAPPARIPAPVNSVRKEVEPKLAAVIHKSLAASPDNRYQQADDFLAALEEAAARLAAAPAPVAAPAAPVAAAVPNSKQTLLQAPLAPVAPAAPAATPAVAANVPEAARAAPSPAAAVSPIAETAPIATPEHELESRREELEQPSVIVDMPEVASAGRKRKLVVFGVAAALAAAVAAVAGLLLFGEKQPEFPPPAEVELIEITILVTPGDAVVNVDGSIVTGDPRVIRVEPGGPLHNISAKAEGYEPLEKDVRFDVSKTVELSMSKVVGPKADASAVAEDDTPDVEEIKEPAAVAAEPVAEPAPEPPAVEEIPAPEPPAAKPVSAVKPPAQKPPAQKPPAQKPPAVEKPKPPPEDAKPATKPKKKGGFDTSNPYG